MKQGSYAKRPRGRGNPRRGGSGQRGGNVESNGPAGKIRGNVSQVLEKYLAMARDATLSGDWISAESFHQFAEHYFRVSSAASGSSGNGANNGQQNAQQPKGREPNTRPDEASADYSAETSSQNKSDQKSRGERNGGRNDGDKDSGDITAPTDKGAAEVISIKTASSKTKEPVKEAVKEPVETASSEAEIENRES